MAEQTRLGKATPIISAQVHRDGEFASVGLELDENLSHFIYDVYLKMGFDLISMPTETHLNKDDALGAFIRGFYLPVTPRLVFSGQVDLTNFDLPDRIDICLPTDNRMLKADKYYQNWSDYDVSFYSMKRLDRLPRGWAMTRKSHAIYKVALRTPADNDGVMSLHENYIVIADDGVVVPALNIKGAGSWEPKTAKIINGLAFNATRGLNAIDEARFLWRVETNEAAVSTSVKTPLRLGVGEEHIKSLFYAREAPITETGRKRPILHWVEAHKRRVQSGVDVDVKKYLRGIHEFTMDSLDFRITSPIKAVTSS